MHRRRVQIIRTYWAGTQTDQSCDVVVVVGVSQLTGWDGFFLPGKFSLKSVPVNSAHATIVNVLSCADGFNQAALIHRIYIAFEIMPRGPSGFRKSSLDFIHFATLETLETYDIWASSSVIN